MFASALKSFSSNITSNYSLSTTPSSFSGPWKIFDAKKKSTGKVVSVFVFEKKSLEPHAGSLGRSGAAGLKRVHEDVLERLKKEAASLARLRHPNVLELVEPVEETRNGLMFATELVTASLAGLLSEKDEQEKAAGVGGRRSRYVVEETEGGGKKRREVEIDELEIQKGLLQLANGLEFLHESAGLVHGNLTPDSIYINSKSDWKISGLGFSGAPTNPTTPTNSAPILLSDVLNYDSRLPRSVQLNLDYSSPDFVLDTNVSPSADMFSLGLLIIALYNSPHQSPIQANSSISAYKRVFSSSSTIPSQSNNFLSSNPIPKDLASSVLPRLITRRPAQRLAARELQQAQYFDNIMVSTIRFLDSLPAKTPNEKAQFMRGLPRVLSQFPKAVLEKKVLPALLEEMKDHELLSLVLQNIFKIINLLPAGRRAFTEKVIPRLRETFLTSGNRANSGERDTGKESGLMMILENMEVITRNCSGKEFKDDILPILHLSMESPLHSLVDAGFRCLHFAVEALDFSTLKNEVFPVVASVFTKTSSLGIKVRGLEAFVVLCGGSLNESTPELEDDGLSGFDQTTKDSFPKGSNAAVLDRFTVQEKLVPLLKGIKTKEPAVMMAALAVFKCIGNIADTDFLAVEVLPILWSLSLGPLLNLEQFQAYMSLIKSISTKVEQEHTRKLRELTSNPSIGAGAVQNTQRIGPGLGGSNGTGGSVVHEDEDFERLVLGQKKVHASPFDGTDGGWDTVPVKRPEAHSAQSHSNKLSDTPVFSWSTPATADPRTSTGSSIPSSSSLQQLSNSRTITPDQSLSNFATLVPSNSRSPTLSQPLQPMQPLQPQLNRSQSSMSGLPGSSGIDWSAATKQGSSNPWSLPSGISSPSQNAMSGTMVSRNIVNPTPLTISSTYTIPPPPISSYMSQPQVKQQAYSNTDVSGSLGNNGFNQGLRTTKINTPLSGQSSSNKQKTGLDAYESLL